MNKMKTLRNLLLASFILIAFGLSAQWGTSGTNIYNTNSGNVGIGINTPAFLLHVAKNMTEPMITIQNTGGIGGATYRMTDNASGADWKFKATQTGGFKVRDQASGLDVFQIEQNSAANRIYIGANDVIGIGTDSPNNHGIGAVLDIRGGDIYFEDANAFLQINNTLTNNNTGVYFSEGGVATSWIWYDGGSDLLRLTGSGGGYSNHLIIRSSGEVGIGTATTKAGYKLSVDGKVACEEVLVENSTNWPDYVFEEGYELMSLEELEESIELNNHLPGMPTAAEVDENGISLGEMQRILLEKIEELTLYTIEQEKRIIALEKENNKLRK